MTQLLRFLFYASTVKLCCLRANRQKVTPSYNISKIVRCPVLSCLFQAHWCKPPFLFSTLAFTGSERRGNGTELGKITVNHGNKPLRISSCSNRTTPLIRSRNFFFFPLFLMNEPKSYTISSHSFPPHMPKTFSPHFSLLTAVKNQVTGNFVLNAKSEDAETKTFIENGLLWEYSNNADKETLKTSGPLHEGIVVLVSGTGSALCIQFSWLSV